MIRAAAVAIVFVLSVGCTKKTEPVNDSQVSEPAHELVAKGKGLYIANCSACHNMDPRKAGSIGPEVAGSSLELLEFRILKNEYPPNYVPKRQSRSMVALPHLKDGLPALHAYLNSL